jgi:tRNA(fMet)-specific endonuclease VapC
MTESPPALVDTDVLSAVMRKHPLATKRARSYLQVHGKFTFSVITRYEVLRGLHVKDASKQLVAFDQLCAASVVLPLTDGIIVQAAKKYADLHRRGQLISDADILIAATAISHGLIVATNNNAHFARIRDLHIRNWLV